MNRIVAFSHLRWNFVFQRPQHLLTRFARKYKVMFVEEPLHDANCAPHMRVQTPQENLLICTPVTNCSTPGYCDEQMNIIRPMLRRLFSETRATGSIGWFYTPMALPLIQDLNPKITIYDCMDELSKFKFAPPDLVSREKQLMKLANLVFTGGPSLYRAKRKQHSDAHCFPSSVECEHFRQSLNGIEEPADQRDLPHPRLGFYGVIDERLDTNLIGYIARKRPQWQIMLVGPVVKISQDSLPHEPNIHYLGMRDYKELPAYLSGWDVCLLPFARNESTEFISPTKTLEYMAAEKPIVSTPITDVKQPYSHIVYLGDTQEEFLAACDRALEAGEQERLQRTNLMRQVLAATSWDKTVRAMDEKIQNVLHEQRARVEALAMSGLARKNGNGASAAVETGRAKGGA